MDTIFFISILLLAASVFALLRRTPRKEPDFLPEPRRFDGLFAERHAEEMKLLAQAEAERSVREGRQRLIGRAAEGDKTALDDAHTLGAAEFYREILRTLVAHADGDEEALRSIAEYIVDSSALRSSGELAAMIIERLSAAPDRSSMIRALHLAALSDDAVIFKRVVETSLNLFGEGRLPQF